MEQLNCHRNGTAMNRTGQENGEERKKRKLDDCEGETEEHASKQICLENRVKVGKEEAVKNGEIKQEPRKDDIHTENCNKNLSELCGSRQSSSRSASDSRKSPARPTNESHQEPSGPRQSPDRSPSESHRSTNNFIQSHNKLFCLTSQQQNFKKGDEEQETVESDAKPNKAAKAGGRKKTEESNEPNSTVPFHLGADGMIEVTGERAHCCNICSKFFTSAGNLRKHILIHKNDRRFKCEQCGKAFLRAYHLNRHKKIHENATASCHLCGKSFRRQKGLEKHMKKHAKNKAEGIGEYPKESGEEGEAVRYNQGYAAQVEEMGWEDASNEAEEKDDNVVLQEGNENEDAVKEEGYHEVIGDYLMAYEGNEEMYGYEEGEQGEEMEGLLEYQNAVIPPHFLAGALPNDEGSHYCGACGQFFATATYLQQHELTHVNDRRYRCEDCGKTFIRPYHLNRHRKVHVNAHMYVCETCGEILGSQEEQLMHMKAHEVDEEVKETTKVENEEQPKSDTEEEEGSSSSSPLYQRLEKVSNLSVEKTHFCRTCGKLFTSASNVRKHQKIHLNERRHKCEECGKRFVRATHLTRHMKVHSNAKLNIQPMPCETCGRTFTRSSALISHMKTHAAKQNAEPLSCKKCDMTFNLHTSFVAHMKSHMNVCSSCGETFGKLDDLAKHVEIHHQDHHSCRFCNEVFSEKVLLAQHEAAHAAEVKFSCNICSESFVGQDSLTRHQTEVHSDAAYKCSVCDALFYSEKSLEGHKHTHAEPDTASTKAVVTCTEAIVTHTESIVTGTESTVASTQPVVTLTEPVVTCSKPAVTHTKSAIASDETSGPLSKDICEIDKLAQTKLTSEQDHASETFRQHVPASTNANSYVCVTCDQKFEEPYQLKEHEDGGSCEKISLFSCDSCSKSFSCSYDLSVHKVRLHPGEKAFQCDTCQEWFSQSYELAQHRLHRCCSEGEGTSGNDTKEAVIKET